VLAFEPSHPNFNQLCRNVTLNGFDRRIFCFPIILSGQTMLGSFSYVESTPGTSRCYHNEEYSSHRKSGKETIEKAALVYALDKFIETFELPRPTMIKIDVDGAEAGVIKGATQILSTSSLETILIEIDQSLDWASDIITAFGSHSFEIANQYHRSGDVYNIIFKKKQAVGRKSA